MFSGAGFLESGLNKVLAKALSPNGQFNPKVLNPKPTNLNIDCEVPQFYAVDFTKNLFIKHPSVAKASKVGNKGGQDLDLNGERLAGTINEKTKIGCKLQLSDTGFGVEVLLLCGNIIAQGKIDQRLVNSVTSLKGYNFGGRLVTAGFALITGGSGFPVVADFGVFAGLTDEVLGKIDVLRGKFYINHKLDNDIVFIRSSE